ncbi:quinone oxidoreductase family protein [Segnochrobactrum spirostomi]|uniref:Quinone oxidoreductase n=1 Tax=Segnochrobactrum spirostomi TaxID=2608987 RepID=A0A6A7XXI6_9HYPH|nr:quinone oxidoreductase [Segnochrobactrum spirostomi]MQT11334.1 quinone oxidoreductase [Segnochrobactrum spirostomi]
MSELSPLLTKAVRVRETGGPEVLKVEEIAVPAPKPGEALIRQTAIGLNYIDTYFRSGLYKTELPFVPGSEGAGVVEALGEGVTGLAVGDRVAYAGGPLGAYAERRVIPADRLVKVPDGVSDDVAAAIMLKGLTAHYLLFKTFPVRAGTVILFHAAAGGVGSIAGQWAHRLGAVTIGTVGSAAKVDAARRNGYAYVIDTSREDFVARINEITDGRGVDVAYDSIGRDTFPATLDTLRPRGMWVTFGQSSGALPPIDSQILSQKGSLFMTRPTLFHYIADRRELEEAAAALFEAVGSGLVEIAVDTYPLDHAADAHRDLQARRTTGSVVLKP